MVSLETKWTTNESLLQSYRSIFISSESFLLAVGAMFFESSNAAFFAIAIMSIITIIFIWLPVVISRQKIVDFYKHSIDLPPEKIKKLCTLEEYVHNKNLRAAANKIFKIQTNWRPTRIKLDGILPAIFCLIWFTLSIFKLYS